MISNEQVGHDTSDKSNEENHDVSNISWDTQCERPFGPLTKQMFIGDDNSPEC